MIQTTECIRDEAHNSEAPHNSTFPPKICYEKYSNIILFFIQYMYNELGKNSLLFRKAQSESDSYSHKIEADSAGNDDYLLKILFCGEILCLRNFFAATRL